MTWLNLLLVILLLFFIASTVVFSTLYHGALQLGAKNVVTALEMVVACEQVGNVTSEQVQEQYFKTFIFNRTGEKNG